MSDDATAAVTAEDVAGMVRACAPGWELREYERTEQGTDFVAAVECATPEGARVAVLKATTAGFVDPEIARTEPRLLRLVGRETEIPVPEVYGAVDRHDEYPAPFYLMEHVDGENVEGRPEELSPAARERVVREAGENLAALHELGTLPRVGSVGVRASGASADSSDEFDSVEDGALAVLDPDHGPVDDFRDHLRAEVEETCDALADGTYFPERADEPDRFADLAEPLRAELLARIEVLSEPEPPRYCHWDYRYGNLLVDPETGETTAVLDWANLTTAEPVYNLAKSESHLLDPGAGDSEARAAALRHLFRESYEAARDDWTLTPEMAARMETYLLLCRAEAMACLPLWLEDASAAEKNERERKHRAFVAEYL